MTTTKRPLTAQKSKSITPARSSETVNEGEQGLGFERLVFFSD
jgi:hypothetical protein